MKTNLNRRKDHRIFRKTASRTHVRNIPGKILQRGGTRLQYEIKISGSTAYITRKNSDRKADISKEVEKYICERAKSNVELGILGKELTKKYPNYKYKDEGYSKLSKYIQSINGIVTKKDGTKWCVAVKK